MAHNHTKHSHKRKMPRLVKMQSKKVGLPPGSVVHTGEQKMDTIRITVLDYDANQCQELQVDRIEDTFAYKDTPSITWINIDGLHEVSVIEKIGNHYNLHPLVQEDIVSTGQRPKMENMEDYMFVVLRMLRCVQETDSVLSEQFSLVLGKNFVISFQESMGDVFEPIRERLRNAKGRIRRMGTDYLVYTLLDAIVDSYFLILERIGDRLEELEEELVAVPTPTTLPQIHRLKREMIYLRKNIWPLREMIANVERSESPLIASTTAPYLRDVYDHTIQVIDTVESYRDIVSGMLDTYLSSISNRMSSVMQVLTIIATTFIPLSFLAGVYGMNFENMPGLKLEYGYLGIWGIMLVIFLAMLYFFRRKKWL